MFHGCIACDIEGRLMPKSSKVECKYDAYSFSFSMQVNVKLYDFNILSYSICNNYMSCIYGHTMLFPF